MKFIRTAAFFRDCLDEDCAQLVKVPVVSIHAAEDMTVTPEEFREKLSQPDVFIVFDEFDYDGGKGAGYLAGALRGDPENETNQAIMYFWTAQMLMHVKERGVLASPGPSPLTVEQTKEVLSQLASHPNYRGQTVESHVWTDNVNDRVLVRMQDGNVEVMPNDR